jgi:hypothetical protein
LGLKTLQNNITTLRYRHIQKAKDTWKRHNFFKNSPLLKGIFKERTITLKEKIPPLGIHYNYTQFVQQFFILKKN